METTTAPRRLPWPRLMLVLPHDASRRLHELARRNYRDPRREALRLVLEGLERDAPEPAELAR